MSVATFTNTMADITVELSDREIYNDIRSQIEGTVEENTSGLGFVAGLGVNTVGVLPVNTYDSISWGTPEVSAWYFEGTVKIDTTVTWEVISSTDAIMYVTVTNLDPDHVVWFTIDCSYTGSYADTVRAYDDTSIKLYGRRVMNLTWPVGQTTEQVTNLAEAYLAKHKDPVPVLVMTVLGSTDTLIVQILTRKISDLITVVNTELGLNGDFYINTVNISQVIGGPLTARWELEQVRLYETTTLFTLDTSELDGAHVLGW